MKTILTFFTFILCLSATAQRLYLNEIQNGNYKSFDVGDNIQFVMTDSTVVHSGVITSFQQDGFTLNDSLTVKLSQITALVKPKEGKGSYTFGRVLLIVLGSYMVVTGSVYFVAGLIVTTIEPSSVGIIVSLFGAAIGAGGYAIANHQVKKARNKNTTLARKEIDNSQYRLILE